MSKILITSVPFEEIDSSAIDLLRTVGARVNSRQVCACASSR